MKNKNKKKQKTLVGYIQNTRVCNHNCLYCSNPDNGRMQKIEKIKKQVDKLKEEGYNDILLTGGEPTLHPQLFETIKYIRNKDLKCRIISNGSKISDLDFLKKLDSLGVHIINLSVYTYKRGLNNNIRQKKGVYKLMVKALQNFKRVDIDCQITTVVSSFNQDHLLETIKFIRNINSQVHHFVFNVLDPLMIKNKKKNLISLPNINNLKGQIVKTFDYLEANSCSFRIERVPLCKIPGYEWANTECRKIVKQDRRKVFFLDERSEMDQSPKSFKHVFRDNCKKCVLKEICSGIDFGDSYYSNVKVEPVKETKQLKRIKNTILNSNK